MRPAIGASCPFINTFPMPHDKLLGMPSAYPAGTMAMRLSLLAVKALPYPALSPFFSSLIRITFDLMESTGRSPGSATVLSPG